MMSHFLTVYGSFNAFFFFFQAEDGIRDRNVTGVQTCALPIWRRLAGWLPLRRPGRERPGRAAEPQVGVCLSVPSSLAGILRVGERDDAPADRRDGAAPGPLAGRGAALPRGPRGADDAPAGRAVGGRAAALCRGARLGARPEPGACGRPVG